MNPNERELDIHAMEPMGSKGGGMDTPTKTWIGVDFSGSHLSWKPNRQGNVWIAVVEEVDGLLRLEELSRVQEMRGPEVPFLRLARFLREGSYAAAGIDAPLSLPADFLAGSHADLLRRVDAIPCAERPFPEAKRFVEEVCRAVGRRADGVGKPLRETERGSGVNTRSTLWFGPRGGAAMTAAAIKLLALAARPVWPWASAAEPGLIVEAFPAAQLKAWGWTYEGYNGRRGEERRLAILERLRIHIDLGKFEPKLIESADAIDAVVCAFAGRAVRRERLSTVCRTEQAKFEGRIAIHENLDASRAASEPFPPLER